MNSRTTSRFRQAFSNLPPPIQRQAREAYRKFQENPSHPSLRFKKVHPALPIYSVRIGSGWCLRLKNFRSIIGFGVASRDAIA